MTDLTIVTGGSSGIGAALAAEAAKRGHAVSVVARRPGAVGTHISADLSQESGWDELAKGVVSHLAANKPETVTLFHCAGTITPIGFADEVDMAPYRSNVILNGAAPQIVGATFLQAVRNEPAKATLVMLTSGAARSIYPGSSSYCAGKAAVDHWVRTVGAEQSARNGAKVVAIAPGVVDTPMGEEIRRTSARDFPRVDKFRTLHDEGDLGHPDDVARRIWEVFPALEGGAVVDLRDL